MIRYIDKGDGETVEIFENQGCPEPGWYWQFDANPAQPRGPFSTNAEALEHANRWSIEPLEELTSANQGFTIPEIRREPAPMTATAEPIDKPALLASLKPGDAVVISFGAHGTQLAVIIKPQRATPNKLIRIWRKAKGRWTQPRRLFAGEIIRKATFADEKQYKPDFGRAWER